MIVISWKALKIKGVKFNNDTNVLTPNSNLLCQLTEKYSHDVFTESPVIKDSHIGSYPNTETVILSQPRYTNSSKTL